MDIKKFNSNGISSKLNMRHIGDLEVEISNCKDCRGGWDFINDSPFKPEWSAASGLARAKSLPLHNKSLFMRQVVSERNKKYSVGNSFRLGIKHSAESRRKISENNGSSGSKWMILGCESKRIPADQVDSHLNNGWIFGRVMR